MKQVRVHILETVGVILPPVLLMIFALVDIPQAGLLSFMGVMGALACIVSSYRDTFTALERMIPVVVLAALAIAGRVLFAPFPDVKPVSAFCILAGMTLGRQSGFMVGALAALGSNMFFGQGPWSVWQMYGWGMVGYLSGCLNMRGWLNHTRILSVWAFASGLLYGFILNSWYVVSFVRPLTWPGALAGYAAGLPLDLIHGAATLAFSLLMVIPLRERLLRMQSIYRARLE